MTRMSRWSVMRLLVVVLALASGGWMAFDGARALVVGDYVTPASGAYAGQLGPWAAVLEAAGLAPRSTPVKSAFVLYGLAVVATAVCFGLRRTGSRKALIVLLPLGLWYVPFGTILNGIALALLFRRSLRTA